MFPDPSEIRRDASADRTQWIERWAAWPSARCPPPMLQEAAARLRPGDDGSMLQLPSALERSTAERCEGHPRDRRRGCDNGERDAGRDEVPGRGAAGRGRTRLCDQV